jgi:hypothetical protein
VSETTARADGIFTSSVLGHKARSDGSGSEVLSDFRFSDRYFNRSDPSAPSGSQKSIFHLNLCCDTDEIAILREKGEVIGVASRLLAEGVAVAFRFDNPLRLGLASSERSTLKGFFSRLSIFCKLLSFLIAARANGEVTSHSIFIVDTPHAEDTFVACFAGEAFKKWEKCRIRFRKNHSAVKFSINILLNYLNISRFTCKHFILLVNCDANSSYS